jgi:hypothetical protein
MPGRNLLVAGYTLVVTADYDVADNRPNIVDRVHYLLFLHFDRIQFKFLPGSADVRENAFVAGIKLALPIRFSDT